MKKLLTVLCFVTLLNSCSSDDSSDSQCSERFDILTAGEWKSDESIFSDMFFNKDGEYYEDGIYDGTWSLSEDCDSIKFKTQAGFEFNFRIIEISETTLTTSLTSYSR